jgi:hexosaminidase
MLFTILAAPTMPPLLPLPTSVKWGDGVVQFSANTKVVSTDKSQKAEAAKIADLLNLKQGGPATGTIRLVKDAAIKDPEGYRLSVGLDGITIRASAPAGYYYGAQTLKQLLPAAQFATGAKATDVQLSTVEIEDAPRFKWRGLMLDTARHFMQKGEIYRFIDLMAMHKLNSFHWHLTDDQGWRIEIKKYPKLTEIGSKRKETMLGRYSDGKYDGTPHGGFYTQQDVRDVVKYAAERHINVVPEIEMPGHAQAAIAAYPELGNLGTQIEVGTKWGVFENVFNPEEKTVSFLQDVLTEVLDLFPSKFIHIGGDECPKTQWKASPRAQALIKERGLKNEDELQSWFIRQMDKWLEKKGRRLIGWDEILEGGLAPGAAVMSWRGMAGGIEAAKEGHDVVMSPTDFAYFDYYQAPSASEPLAIGGYLPLEKVYSFEPVPASLTPEEAKHILGGQANLWTEYIPSARKAQYMMFPRASAMSEVLWSPKSERNWAGFQTRLPAHLERLQSASVNFRKLDAGR